MYVYFKILLKLLLYLLFYLFIWNACSIILFQVDIRSFCSLVYWPSTLNRRVSDRFICIKRVGIYLHFAFGMREFDYIYSTISSPFLLLSWLWTFIFHSDFVHSEGTLQYFFWEIHFWQILYSFRKLFVRKVFCWNRFQNNY